MRFSWESKTGERKSCLYKKTLLVRGSICFVSKVRWDLIVGFKDQVFFPICPIKVSCRNGGGDYDDNNGSNRGRIERRWGGGRRSHRQQQQRKRRKKKKWRNKKPAMAAQSTLRITQTIVTLLTISNVTELTLSVSILVR